MEAEAAKLGFVYLAKFTRLSKKQLELGASCVGDELKQYLDICIPDVLPGPQGNLQGPQGPSFLGRFPGPTGATGPQAAGNHQGPGFQGRSDGHTGFQGATGDYVKFHRIKPSSGAPAKLDIDVKECNIDLNNGNWLYDSERGMLGGLGKHTESIERWLNDPMKAHDVLLIDGSGKSGKSSLADTVLPHIAAKKSPKSHFVVVNLEQLRNPSTYYTKLQSLFGLLSYQLGLRGFSLHIRDDAPDIQLQHLIAALSELDLDGGHLVIVFDEMQFLYSELPTQEREAMATFLKSIIGGKKSLLRVRFVFLGSNSATLYPGLDSGLYDGFHPMRDNVTISTFPEDTQDDLDSMAVFCTKKYSIPAQLARELISAAPYKTCWYLQQVSAIYPDLKKSPDFELGTTVQSQASALLNQFLIRVFEIYRRDWCCFSEMPEVLPKLFPYLKGIDKLPTDPWAAQLVVRQGGVYVLKDKFFVMFLFRCCDFSQKPPALSANLVSMSLDFDWSCCFLALQLLPIDANMALLRKSNKIQKFFTDVEALVQLPKLDAVRAAVRAHAEAELAAMQVRLENSQVSKKNFDDAKRELEGRITSVATQHWGTVVIFSRQVLAHDSTGFDFHFCSEMGKGLLQDFGRDGAQAFLNACKSVSKQMLGPPRT